MNRPIVVHLLGQKGKLSSGASALVIYPSSSLARLDSSWVAKENDILYEIRLDAGPSMGLFLNQRLQRNWIRHHCKDKSVLNLFSYTGTFSLAAAMGQAQHVTTVDTNKGALNWGRKNFALNNLDGDSFKFLCRDSLTFLDQCQSKGTKYDIIVCDAPSFLKMEKGLFKIKTDMETLLQRCLSCLNAKGELLFSTSFDGFFIEDIRSAITKVQKKLKISQLSITCLLPSLDFELPGEKANLKSFLIRRE